MVEPNIGVLAVDVGGTRLRVAVYDGVGRMRAHVVHRTPRNDPNALLAAMREAAQQAHDVEILEAIVGIPGPVDYRYATAPELPQLPGWQGAISASAIAEGIGLPVVLANDADLAAVGEHRLGAGVGVDHMVYVTCSTGIGAGVIVDGKLLHTRYSLAEVGHTILDWRNGETVEQRGSGTALSRLGGEDAAVIAARAAEGDAEALGMLHEVGDALSVGVLTLVYCFMPDRVVIGGGMAQSGELLLTPVRDRIARSPRCSLGPQDIMLATGGDDAGLRGAFAFWLDRQEAV